MLSFSPFLSPALWASPFMLLSSLVTLVQLHHSCSPLRSLHFKEVLMINKFDVEATF